jgi:hypothetical protein
LHATNGRTLALRHVAFCDDHDSQSFLSSASGPKINVEAGLPAVPNGVFRPRASRSFVAASHRASSRGPTLTNVADFLVEVGTSVAIGETGKACGAWR